MHGSHALRVRGGDPGCRWNEIIRHPLSYPRDSGLPIEAHARLSMQHIGAAHISSCNETFTRALCTFISDVRRLQRSMW
nr:hypothetical protein CFP56_01308 [Quercus suber]